MYLAEAAFFAALALLAGHFWLPAVLALALVDGAVAIVGRALTRAAVAAALKPSGLLQRGNALLNVSFSMCFAAGPALGGAVVAIAGVGVSLSVTATLFAVMAATLATSGALPAAHRDDERDWRRACAPGWPTCAPPGRSAACSSDTWPRRRAPPRWRRSRSFSPGRRSAAATPATGCSWPPGGLGRSPAALR